MGIILGIDGGGTKTQAAIIDERGRLRGTGFAGPANVDSVGIEVARANIRHAVDQARSAANLPEPPYDAAFLGLAGVVSATDHRIVHEIAEALELAPPERIGVDHDCRIALAGGLSGRPGIVLIAGTGSSCYGINAQGEGWRSGGWGHLISDEGSSYWLGTAAMRLSVMAADGRVPPTALVDAVLRYLDIPDMDAIMHRIYVPPMSKTELAALAPLVIETANGGDAAALELLRRGASDLADCVLAVARRLGMDGNSCELALVGGLLHPGSPMSALVGEETLARLPRCVISSPELPPVLGACVLGLQALGLTIDGEVAQTLRESARSLEKP